MMPTGSEPLPPDGAPRLTYRQKQPQGVDLLQFISLPARNLVALFFNKIETVSAGRGATKKLAAITSRSFSLRQSSCGPALLMIYAPI